MFHLGDRRFLVCKVGALPWLTLRTAEAPSDRTRECPRVPAPQRLLWSPSALPAESCSQHRPLSCWASLPLQPPVPLCSWGSEPPPAPEAKGAFSLHEKQNVDLPLLSGEEETPGPLASSRSESPADPESPQEEGLRLLGLRDSKLGRSRAGKLPLSLSGALTVPPPKGQAGRPALPSAPGLCCLLTPAGDALRPVAFLIIPNQNCIPPGEGFPQPLPL